MFSLQSGGGSDRESARLAGGWTIGVLGTLAIDLSAIFSQYFRWMPGSFSESEDWRKVGIGRQSAGCRERFEMQTPT